MLLDKELRDVIITEKRYNDKIISELVGVLTKIKEYRGTHHYPSDDDAYDMRDIASAAISNFKKLKSERNNQKNRLLLKKIVAIQN